MNTFSTTEGSASGILDFRLGRAGFLPSTVCKPRKSSINIPCEIPLRFLTLL